MFEKMKKNVKWALFFSVIKGLLLLTACNPSGGGSGIGSSFEPQGKKETLLSSGLEVESISDKDASNNAFNLLGSQGFDSLKNSTGEIPKPYAGPLVESTLSTNSSDSFFSLAEGESECKSFHKIMEEALEEAVEKTLSDEGDTLTEEEILSVRQEAFSKAIEGAFEGFDTNGDGGLDQEELASYLSTVEPLKLCEEDDEFFTKMEEKAKNFLDRKNLTALALKGFKDLAQKLRRKADQMMSEGQGFLTKEEALEKIEELVGKYKEFLSDFLEYEPTLLEDQEKEENSHGSEHFNHLLESADENEDEAFSVEELVNVLSLPFLGDETEVDICEDTKICEKIQSALDDLGLELVSTIKDLRRFEKHFRKIKHHAEHCFNIQNSESDEDIFDSFQKRLNIHDCPEGMTEEDLPEEASEELKEILLANANKMVEDCEERNEKITEALEGLLEELGLDEESDESLSFDSCLSLMNDFDELEKEIQLSAEFAPFDLDSSETLTEDELFHFIRHHFHGFVKPPKPHHGGHKGPSSASSEELQTTHYEFQESYGLALMNRNRAMGKKKKRGNNPHSEGKLVPPALEEKALKEALESDGMAASLIEKYTEEDGLSYDNARQLQRDLESFKQNQD